MICEICNEHKAYHKHHIESKCFGGKNKKHNLCNLCPNCHTKVHKGFIIIEGYFLTSNGYQLIWHLSDEESITNVSPNVFVVGKNKSYQPQVRT